jgi:hypothetical protein
MSQIVALPHIALGIHFVAQQALCNALGALGLHWVWARPQQVHIAREAIQLGEYKLRADCLRV